MKFHPSWEVGEDGKSLIEGVDTPFRLDQSLGAFGDVQVQAIMMHWCSPKAKGMPGATPSMIWKVYSAIQSHSEMINDVHCFEADHHFVGAGNIKSIRLSEPVVSSSFTPMHLTFDYEDYTRRKDHVRTLLSIEFSCEVFL
jgi:hypothetical protein